MIDNCFTYIFIKHSGYHILNKQAFHTMNRN